MVAPLLPAATAHPVERPVPVRGRIQVVVAIPGGRVRDPVARAEAVQHHVQGVLDVVPRAALGIDVEHARELVDAADGAEARQDLELRVDPSRGVRVEVVGGRGGDVVGRDEVLDLGAGREDAVRQDLVPRVLVAGVRAPAESRRAFAELGAELVLLGRRDLHRVHVAPGEVRVVHVGTHGGLPQVVGGQPGVRRDWSGPGPPASGGTTASPPTWWRRSSAWDLAPSGSRPAAWTRWRSPVEVIDDVGVARVGGAQHAERALAEAVLERVPGS